MTMLLFLACTGGQTGSTGDCDSGIEPTTSTTDTGWTTGDSGTDTQDTVDTADTADTADTNDTGGPPPTEARSLLRAAVGFFGAQRCGDAHNWIIADHDLGGTCHLQDGPDLGAGIDLTGGWHDAGDYIKPTLTIAYSAYVMMKALEVWPDAFDDLDDGDYTGQPNGIPDVLDEVIVALDYLAGVQVGGNLVVMVGGEEDHNLFVTSPYQSTLGTGVGGGERRVTADGKADVAGILAAALALGSVQIRAFDTDRADAWLDLARSALTWGENHAGGSNADFYTGADPQANLLAGAAELYRATGEEAFLTAALGYDSRVGKHYWVPLWDNPSDYARHSLAAAGQKQVQADWTHAVQSYLDAVSTNPNVAGLSWFYDWGTLAVATHTAASAGLLYALTGEQAYEEFARGQVRWVLGDNPYNRSFVVGMGTDPPVNPHHANGYGHDDIPTDWNLAPLNSVTGALVGGPTSAVLEGFPAGYEDDVENYVGNEVTLDYNAGLVAATAFAVSRGD